MAKEEKKSVDEKLSDALQIEFEPIQEVETSIVQKASSNLPITKEKMDKDLLELHQKMKNITKEEIEINSTTNQSIYVGSTRDLQDLINESRSAKKALETYDDVIDAEIEIVDDK